MVHHKDADQHDTSLPPRWWLVELRITPCKVFRVTVHGHACVASFVVYVRNPLEPLDTGGCLNVTFEESLGAAVFQVTDIGDFLKNYGSVNLVRRELGGQDVEEAAKVAPDGN